VTGSGPFPSTSTFYQDISQAMVDPESTTIMTSLLAAWPGGSGTSGLGIDPSMVILNAAASVARRPFDNGGDDPDCDAAPVPLPAGGHIEGSTGDYSCDGGDCHLLVYQGARLYELYQADVSTGLATGGTFSGGCLVVWDLTHDYWQPATPPGFSRGDHCNGADAADIPIAPLTLTAADLQSGQPIRHAFRFTIPNAQIRAAVYVHPATHIGGPTGGADKIPYGARLRLKSTVNISTLSAAGQAVARALQTYGMFLTDGGNLFLTATEDVAPLISASALRGFRATDFEMVTGGPRYNWRDYQCTRTVITN
jgi:serine/threonine-protein kinase